MSLPHVLMTAIGLGVAVAGAAEPAIELTDLDGQRHAPLRQVEKRAAVLFFLLPDCPISNAYAPEIQRIAAEYGKQDVACYAVYVDPEMTTDAARKHAVDYGLKFPALRDTELRLVRATGVKIAPTAVVVGPQGDVLYRGRIDDLYAGYGKRRAKASQPDLRNALDAVLAGRPVEVKESKSFGCFISLP